MSTSNSNHVLLSEQCSNCHEPRSTTNGGTLQRPNLYICTGCRVVRYCSSDHQIAHWPKHKPFCLPIKRSRAEVEVEERKIRTNPSTFKNNPDWSTFYMPGNPFEHGIDFWAWEPSRRYMQARWRLIESLRKVNTRESLEKAVEEGMAMLKLNRSDDLRLRDVLPSLMIRLGEDQRAYDFLKWWTTIEDGFDWGDPDLPYLKLEDEDIEEDVAAGGWQEGKRGTGLADLVAVALIKLGVSLKLKSREADLLANGVSETGRDSISTETSNSTSHSATPESDDFVNLSARRTTLSAQLDILVEAVQRRNEHFWPALIAGQDPMAARLRASAAIKPITKLVPGSKEESSRVIDCTCDAWQETPVAQAWLKAKCDEKMIVAPQQHSEEACWSRRLRNRVFSTPARGTYKVFETARNVFSDGSVLSPA